MIYPECPACAESVLRLALSQADPARYYIYHAAVQREAAEVMQAMRSQEVTTATAPPATTIRTEDPNPAACLFVCEVPRKRHRKAHKCPECGKVLSGNSRMTVHRLMHNNLKPYLCEICGQLFRQISHYKRHTNRHTQNYPYRCLQCKKGFQSSKRLKIHEECHNSDN